MSTTVVIFGFIKIVFPISNDKSSEYSLELNQLFPINVEYLIEIPDTSEYLSSYSNYVFDRLEKISDSIISKQLGFEERFEIIGFSQAHDKFNSFLLGKNSKILPSKQYSEIQNRFFTSIPIRIYLIKKPLELNYIRKHKYIEGVEDLNLNWISDIGYVSDGEHLVSVNLDKRKIYLCGQKKIMTPKKNTGKFLAIPDLLGSQLIVFIPHFYDGAYSSESGKIFDGYKEGLLINGINISFKNGRKITLTKFKNLKISDKNWTHNYFIYSFPEKFEELEKTIDYLNFGSDRSRYQKP